MAKLISLIAFGCVLSGVSTQLTQNHESVVVTEGESMDLLCSANSGAKACSFSSPGGDVFVMFEGANYDGGRVEQYGNTPNDCGARVINVAEKDNGQWTCTVTVINAEGSFERVSGEIEVTVAVAPGELRMRNNGEDVIGNSMTFKLEETDEAANIDCVAAQTRPKPEFKWFIGNELVQGQTTDSEENMDDSGKGDYVQTLMYFPNALHNQKELKCVVDHEAYSTADLESQRNQIAKKFELFFKPMEKPKEQVFYGLKVGQAEKVTITFEANPRPTEGEWMLADMTSPVAFGAADLEEKYNAEQLVENEDVRGEYSATLNIMKVTPEMSGKVNKLIVTNEEGTTEYVFKLELGEKPPAEPVGSGTVIGVIIIACIILLIVIVAVVARSKGILCFETKNGEQLQEEKDGAAFDNVEKGQPLNPKPTSTGDDKKPEDANNAGEDKKSNGAHTPV